METKKFYFLFSLLPLSLCALPVGEKVKAGSAHFSKQESILQIEASDKTIIDFESFHIQNGEKVLFVQPKSSSTLLSRVQGNDPSQILGTLSSNGKVFLVNPHGVYFGQDAIVDTGSLIVSTLDVLNEDFLQERYCFFSTPGQQLGEIRNEGILTALEGSVALIGPRIANEGVILADVGRVLFASAEKVTLDFSGDGMMAFAVDNMMTAENLQDQVVLGQSATQKIIEGVINADGFIAGSALVEKEGIISLVPSSHIAAQDIVLTGTNIQLEGSLIASQDLYVEAQEILCVRDSMESPLVLLANQQMTLNAPVIDILTLQHAGTQIVSGGDMALVSNNPISADAHFYAGGNFSLLTLEGTPGDFISFFDPIITSAGDVSFGNYSGVSLKVQAAGNITATGTINITGPDTEACTNCSGDPDCLTLQTTRALILRAGNAPIVSCMETPPNVSAGGTVFMGTASPSGSSIFLRSSVTGIDTAIFDGPVVLTGEVAMTGIGTQPITFTDSINGNFILTISNPNGLISFGGNIEVYQLVPTSNTGIELGGNIIASGAGGVSLVFPCPVTLTNNVTIENSGPITFGSTIDSVSTTPFNLVIQSSGSTSLTLEGDIGSVHPLENLTASLVYNVYSTPGITINAESINFTVGDGLDPLIVGILTAGAGGITLESPHQITLTENLTTMDGPVNVNGRVVLAANIAITSNGGNQTFSSTVDGTTAGVQSLTVNAGSGDVTFGGSIGTSESLSSLSVTATEIILGSSLTIDTTSGMNLNAPINGTAYSLTLTSTNDTILLNDPITVANLTVTSTDANIQVNTPITATDFTVTTASGNIVINNAINGTVSSLILTSTSGTIELNDPITVSTLAVTATSGSIQLNADITTSDTFEPLVLTGPVVLGNSITITPGQTLTFTSTVDSSVMGGPFDLIILSPNIHFISFEGNVGSIQPLGTLLIENFSSLSTTGVSINANEINFLSSYVNSSLNIGALTAGDGGITLSVAKAITVNGPLTATGTGNISFPASSMSSLDLLGTLTTASGSINIGIQSTLAGNLTTTSGSIDITAPATLTGDVTIAPLYGNLNFVSLIGTGTENLTLEVGRTASLGTMSALNEINAFTGAILLNGPISANAVDFLSSGSITNAGHPYKISLSGASTFLTTSAMATIGTALSPIDVVSTNTITAGTDFAPATFIGTTMGNTIIPDVTLIPCPLIFNSVQIPTTGCVPAPSSPGGAAMILSSSNNSPISITTGSSGQVLLNSGTSNASTQIVSTNTSLNILADGDITAVAGFGTNAFTSVTAGTALELQSTNGDISFSGGSSSGTYALVTTTQGGEITLTAPHGSIHFTGGTATKGNAQANITTQAGGDINLNALNLNLAGVIGPQPNAHVNVVTGTNIGNGNITGTFGLALNATGATISTGFSGGDINLSAGNAATFDFVNVSTGGGGGDITLYAGGNLTFEFSSGSTKSGNVSLSSGGSINLESGTFNVDLPSNGTFSAMGGVNISFDSSSFIQVSGANEPLIQLVVDSNNPTSVGTGSFIYPEGARISLFPSSGESFVRIYTSARVNNLVGAGAVINGMLYTPSNPPGTDTNQEVWNTKYPTVPAAPEDGSDYFTIYYKSLND